MTFTKTSQKFGQWADSRANTVFGLGFASEQQLAKVRRDVPAEAQGHRCELESSQKLTGLYAVPIAR